jgi:DMSO/TMAO reductase YedYZ molybdopterin-dependent catalytic subunit
MQTTHTKILSHKQRFALGLQTGLLAGILASALMLLLSVTINGVSLPNVLGSTITRLLPLTTFESLHQLLGANSKLYLFIIILIGQCLVFALSGGICSLLSSTAHTAPPVLPTALTEARANESSQEERHNAGQLRWSTGILLTLVLWLLTGFIFLPVTGTGLFGLQLSGGVSNTMVSLAIVGVAFGLLFVLIQNWLALRRLQTQGIAVANAVTENMSRRVILRNGLTLAGLGVLGLAAWRLLTNLGGSSAASQVASTSDTYLSNVPSKITPPPIPNYGTIQPVPHLSAEITPNNEFYLVSKNLFSDPVVDAGTWNLQVDGVVEQPYTLTYPQLLALPLKQQYETLMCISNEVGGQYISNARWDGIVLADLLKRAGGVKAGADTVIFYAADGYSESLPLSKALTPTTLLALRMNGSALPQEHGFPARLLVPGRYGMKHVKWMTRIRLSRRPRATARRSHKRRACSRFGCTPDRSLLSVLGRGLCREARRRLCLCALGWREAAAF